MEIIAITGCLQIQMKPLPRTGRNRNKAPKEEALKTGLGKQQMMHGTSWSKLQCWRRQMLNL